MDIVDKVEAAGGGSDDGGRGTSEEPEIVTGKSFCEGLAIEVEVGAGVAEGAEEAAASKEAKTGG